MDYALRIAKEFPKERMIVAGYSNDVMAYIPTAAMLQEGGYEPVSSMMYYELPSPFASDVEDRRDEGCPRCTATRGCPLTGRGSFLYEHPPRAIAAIFFFQAKRKIVALAHLELSHSRRRDSMKRP